MPFRGRPEWVAYTVTALVLWFVPLFDRLHVESSAVVATVAYFAAGWAVLSGRSLVSQLAAPGIAFVLLTVSAVWAPNCDWLRGAGFFLLFVPVTVVFAAAVAGCCRAWTRHPRRWLVGIGLLVLVAGPVHDLGWHPQFYTYNHIFGGILGPIYDEELVIRPGLFVFRGLTLVWALLLWALVRRRWAVATPSGLAIALVYVFQGPLGITTPSSWLDASYPGLVRTEHFEIRYDTAGVSPDRLRRLVDDHEWYHERLVRITGVVPVHPIVSYINADVDARARRTGARYTSVAPVWLSRPQMHLAWSSVDAVLSHELAHVFSREFGMPVIRASPLVGLVEGFAAAVEAPDGGIDGTDLVAAAWTGRWDAAGRNLAGALDPLGFWTGRGAVSYAMSGSFVAFLLESYGMAPFAGAYRTGRLAGAYGVPVDSLAAAWAHHLASRTVLSADAGPRASVRFGVPSLFERTCPHHVPRHVRRYREAIAKGDAEALRDLIRVRPTFWPAHLSLADLLLPSTPDAVPALLAEVPDSDRRRILLAHAAARMGSPTIALSAYRAELIATPVSSRVQRVRLAAWMEDVASGRTPDPELLAGPGSPADRVADLDGVGATCPSVAVCGDIERLRGYWTMRRAYELGDLVGADSVAARTRASSLAVGDRDMVRLLDDWRARIAWAMSDTP